LIRYPYSIQRKLTLDYFPQTLLLTEMIDFRWSHNVPNYLSGNQEEGSVLLE
jgi:hypothetical protein